MSAPAVLTTVVVDSADPAALAAFYQKVTGWEITSSDDDSASLAGGPIALLVQRVEGYRVRSWPEHPAHVHLDFTVTDIDAQVDTLLALGATRPEFQPGGSDWTVLTDPDGHPFCISAG